ncbi:MAG: DUF952 domain-containing protein [Actinomycetota bacterium]
MSDDSIIYSENNLIYHVTTKNEWNQAQKTGVYDRSTRGKSFNEIGFIHASLKNQVEEVAKFLYSDVDEDLVVLTMDLQSLEASGYIVRFEDGGNGQLYPHIYSPIAIESIINIRDGIFDDLGNFVFAE